MAAPKSCSIAAAALLFLAMTCDKGFPGSEILSPSDLSVVRGNRAQAVIELHPAGLPDTLEILLDDVDVTDDFSFDGRQWRGQLEGLGVGPHKLQSRIVVPSAGGGTRTPKATSEFSVELIRVLLFTRTQSFRHPSIDDALSFFTGLNPGHGLAVTASEDPTVFDDAQLSNIDVILFANTSGDILDASQQAAMERFIRSGKGFVGVHAAADTERTWPWYGRLVGAYFEDHPPPMPVTVTTEHDDHPASAHLPPSFVFDDEWYNFDRNPRNDNVILLTLDEAGDPGFSMGDDHPIAWHKQFDGGRSFYTNLGHRPETWGDPAFQTHLLEAIRWAASPLNYNRIVLDTRLVNPVGLDVAPDGRVFYIEIAGELRMWDPASGINQLVGEIAVDRQGENGLLGLALDPDFDQNEHLYLYYAEPLPVPTPVAGPPGENVLSRFSLAPDGTLDPASRFDLLRVPSTRECCHEGGGLAVSPEGLIFLSTGDNTNPFDSEGTAPIDERPGREHWNAQRTAANPDDLRGKILRLNLDGSIPADNPLPVDGSQGRPEIFAMGNRNPFRIAVDPVNGRVYWGDVGPDASVDTPRGPRGYDEINFADGPGHYGWPFCIADNLPYADYDFDTGTTGPAFSCNGFIPPLLSYDYDSVDFLALGNATTEQTGFAGRTAIAGEVFRLPPVLGGAFWKPLQHSLPVALDGQLLMTDWTRDILAAVDVSSTTGSLESIERLIPFEAFGRPIDVDVGPDGAVYVLEYGTNLIGPSDDARISRIEHSPSGDLTPVASLEAMPQAGWAPLAVSFSSAGSRTPRPGEEITSFEWDFDGNGSVDSTDPEPSYLFAQNGLYPVTLTVVSSSGTRSFPAVEEVVVGNRPPLATITLPLPGTPLSPFETVQLDGFVVDPDEGPVPCEFLTWDVRLGHNAHAHPIIQRFGCAPTFTAQVDPGHAGSTGLFYVVELSYKDNGGPGGEPRLTGRAEIQLSFE